MTAQQKPEQGDRDEFRGSRKQILDLLDDSSYVRRMNALLRSRGDVFGSVSHADKHQPPGSGDPAEWEIERFVQTYCSEWLDAKELEGWWLPQQPKMPKGATWDLISTCTVEGRSGLLLVEAKAHEKELGRGGKTKPSGSAQSEVNDLQIRKRLTQVTAAMRAGSWNAAVTADSHYQLANRLAWAWKLADCGIPVVLLYLGFLGDTYFPDYLRNRDHWQRTMGAYMDGVVPLNLPENRISLKTQGSFVLLIRSFPVLV